MHSTKTFVGASALASLLGASTVAAEPSAAAGDFAGLKGEVVLDNARVRVDKYLLHPGQSTGAFHHGQDQLLVFVKGGVLKSASGRSILWKDGRVAWQNASQTDSPASSNAGSEDIEMICVNLKAQPAAAPGKPTYQHLDYPNIPGEDLLENDSVIVQRFTVNPGQWEGVHAHHPNMLWIHIRGGQWAARTKSEPEHAYPNASADGSVGWMAPVELRVGHESGNIGKSPIDLVWVTLKK